jgi:hypothetical protein
LLLGLVFGHVQGYGYGSAMSVAARGWISKDACLYRI